MKQEDYIKRGIERFKALDDKTQTELIDYLTLKIVACGFIKEYTVTTKNRFLFLHDALLGSQATLDV